MTNGEALAKEFPQLRIYEIGTKTYHVLIDGTGIVDFDLYVSKEWWSAEHKEN